MARYIMFQGTGSGVGKSIIVAGFCRLFAQRGIKVAPFKAQNMSLNSAVTPLGEEIGRAQMLQARAAFVIPDSRMNPVLLKPQGDKTSQVIVRGKAWETHEAYDYYQHKDFLWKKVTDSLNSLAEEYDLICIEGAGSPAEINLRDKDIVNMAVARYAQAPVCLIGDIEKGGVFAQLYGTWALLNNEERKLLCGFIINKFRGDSTILEPGLREIEQLTSIPILGVVPYSRFRLDDEDSQTEKIESPPMCSKTKDIQIGIIRLPHISNFNDFDPLDCEPDVETRYLYPDENLDGFDVIILPGSKNTIHDLRWLENHGFQSSLEKFIARGGVVFGICGGYQMLGESIADPNQIESQEGKVRGLSLIPLETVLEREKVLRVVNGWVASSDQVKVKGYEIHMGRSRLLQSIHPLFVVYCGNRIEHEGVVINGKIYGTYLHGLFEEWSFRRYFLNAIRKQKGLFPIVTIIHSWQEIVEIELDRLANLIDMTIDIDRIERASEKISSL